MTIDSKIEELISFIYYKGGAGVTYSITREVLGQHTLLQGSAGVTFLYKGVECVKSLLRVKTGLKAHRLHLDQLQATDLRSPGTPG